MTKSNKKEKKTSEVKHKPTGNYYSGRPNELQNGKYFIVLNATDGWPELSHNRHRHYYYRGGLAWPK